MGLQEAIKKAEKFRESLEDTDEEAFDDMLKDAQAYAPQANEIAQVSAYEEFPLLFTILFAHNRKITKVEKDQILKKH